MSSTHASAEPCIIYWSSVLPLRLAHMPCCATLTGQATDSSAPVQLVHGRGY